MKRLLALSLLVPTVQAATCTGTLYLTIDTGTMEPAQQIVDTLKKHNVKATFFIANEPTSRGDMSLEDSWAPFWKQVAKEGHAFGTHTWKHWYVYGQKDGKVLYAPFRQPSAGQWLDQAAFCAELKKPDTALKAMTGRGVDAIWRAPGGRTNETALKFAKQCGYQHVHWSDAGFLGDELDSTSHPNKKLLSNAMTNLRDGDIMMMHLGIRSRKEPFHTVLEPLIAGLKSKGFCFDTIPHKLRRKT